MIVSFLALALAFRPRAPAIVTSSSRSLRSSTDRSMAIESDMCCLRGGVGRSSGASAPRHVGCHVGCQVGRHEGRPDTATL